MTEKIDLGCLRLTNLINNSYAIGSAYIENAGKAKALEKEPEMFFDVYQDKILFHAGASKTKKVNLLKAYPNGYRLRSLTSLIAAVNQHERNFGQHNTGFIKPSGVPSDMRNIVARLLPGFKVIWICGHLWARNVPVALETWKLLVIQLGDELYYEVLYEGDPSDPKYSYINRYGLVQKSDEPIAVDRGSTSKFAIYPAGNVNSIEVFPQYGYTGDSSSELAQLERINISDVSKVIDVMPLVSTNNDPIYSGKIRGMHPHLDGLIAFGQLTSHEKSILNTESLEKYGVTAATVGDISFKVTDCAGQLSANAFKNPDFLSMSYWVFAGFTCDIDFLKRTSQYSVIKREAERRCKDVNLNDVRYTDKTTAKNILGWTSQVAYNFNTDVTIQQIEQSVERDTSEQKYAIYHSIVRKTAPEVGSTLTISKVSRSGSYAEGDGPKVLGIYDLPVDYGDSDLFKLRERVFEVYLPLIQKSAKRDVDLEETFGAKADIDEANGLWSSGTKIGYNDNGDEVFVQPRSISVMTGNRFSDLNDSVKATALAQAKQNAGVKQGLISFLGKYWESDQKGVDGKKSKKKVVGTDGALTSL